MARIGSLLVFVVATLVAMSAHAQSVTFEQRLSGPSAGAEFGRAVAVDGDWAVIGSPAEDGTRGAANIFERVADVWVQRQRIVASDGAVNDYFGLEVGMSGDTIVVGTYLSGPANLRFSGALYVFVRTSGSWTQQAKLVASDRAAGDGLGTSVSIRGNVIVAGASVSRPPGQGSGAVYIFERTGTTWNQQKLQPPAAAGIFSFGGHVDLAQSAFCVTARDAAFVVVRGAGGWTIQQQLTATDFNAACALDGDTLMVAGEYSPGTSFRGRVFVYGRVGTSWVFQQNVVPSVDPAPNLFGASLDLAGDRLLVGAPFAGVGAAFVFERTPAGWTELQRLDGTGITASDSFGSVVALDAQTLLVGAPNFNNPAQPTSSPGFVHIWRAPTSGTPGAPSDFSAAVAGNTVSMSWAAPVSGAAPTGYTLIARSGGTVVATVPLGLVTSFSASAPNGTYGLSMRATNAAGSGPESALVTVSLPSGVSAPGPPSGLTVTVTGSTAGFTWNPPTTGGAPAGYLLVAGTAPGFTTPVATLPLPATPSVAVPGVPTGTFYVRVMAQNGGGISGASNEVSLTVGAATIPGAPTMNPASVSGSTVNLSWTPGSGAATSYTLRAFGPTGVPLVTLPGLTGNAISFSAVPSGAYALDLLAVNAAGASAPSNRITLAVP